MSALPSLLEFTDARLLRTAPTRRASAAAEHKAEDRELSALMRAAQHGDRAAYTRLVREIMPLLQRVLRARLRFLQAADRDDLMQEVLLSLHRGMMTYDPQREFVPWMMTIARNKMVDRARRFARSIANEVLVDDFAEIGAAEQLASRPDSDGDPEALRQAISRLSASQRKAIELLKIRELSSGEAAEVTGMSPGALRVSVHRAIKTLRVSFSNDTEASSRVEAVMTRSALERTALSVPITSSAPRLKVSTRVTWVLTTEPVGLTSGNGRGRRIARRARCRDRTRRGALKQLGPNG
jgi:RNA polymerase sigma factor (sigma-70 family)